MGWLNEVRDFPEAALAHPCVVEVAVDERAVVGDETSQGTDACLNGVTTVITGGPCSPGTPSVAHVCATGIAHATNGADYCPAPRVVTVGEYELGTLYVPLAASTRLDVAMRRTSVQSSGTGARGSAGR